MRDRAKIPDEIPPRGNSFSVKAGLFRDFCIKVEN